MSTKTASSMVGGRSPANSTIALALTLACILSGSVVWRRTREGEEAAAHVHRNNLHQKDMAKNLILWLHGLGDSGPNNMPIRNFFSAPEFFDSKWLFPSAPSQRITCNRWPMKSMLQESPKDEEGILKSVEKVHEMIDKEIATGISPKNIFVCGFSQGGALTVASMMLYPKTLGGAAVFSGWVPFNSSFIEKISPEAKQTPVLWSHGMSDNVVEFSAGQAGPPLLEHAGVNCQFKAYPGLGHSLNSEELTSLQSWIKYRLQSSSQ